MTWTGKTYLAGTAVDKARTLGRTLFAFLSYAQASSTSALAVLQSLIFQLAADDEDLQTALCELDRQNLRSSIGVAIEILKTLLAYAGIVYIVIDGLDEINEIERCLLVKHLRDDLKDLQEARVLISSRSEADLQKLLGDHAKSVQVNNQNAKSIQAFVKRWTTDWFEERQFLPQEMVGIEAWLAPLALKSKGL